MKIPEVTPNNPPIDENNRISGLGLPAEEVHQVQKRRYAHAVEKNKVYAPHHRKPLPRIYSVEEIKAGQKRLGFLNRKKEEWEMSRLEKDEAWLDEHIGPSQSAN